MCAAYGASIMAWNCSSRVADADGGVVDVAGVAGAVGASDAIVAAWGWRGAGAGLSAADLALGRFRYALSLSLALNPVEDNERLRGQTG